MKYTLMHKDIPVCEIEISDASFSIENTGKIYNPEHIPPGLSDNNNINLEGFHRMLRKFTKTKTNFPIDDSLKKSIYLSVKEISKKWNNPVRDWGKIIGQFMMFFEERFEEIQTA